MQQPYIYPITLYGIVNCDTVKKARAWLTAQGRDHVFHDFKKLGVPEGQLDHWLATAGWEKLLNRKGTSWRRLDAATQSGVQDAPTARALMLDQASVIKRPVAQWGDQATGTVTVGFDVAVWQSLLDGPGGELP
jgi:Spx/MgsR family transcriptional regulator